jgi:dihydroneopterin aldolase
VITCEEFLSEFGDYLDNRAAPEVREQLELHLAQCRSCQVLYDTSLKTIKIVTESSSFDLPKDVAEPIVERVMAKIRGEQQK